MILLNPTFRDPGGHPGEAAHWTLRTLCQVQRIAAFGPVPAQAVENFERWLELRTTLSQGDIVVAMFDALAEGCEDFEEGWNDGPLLTQLTGGKANPALLSGNELEDMQAGWLPSPFASAWSDVTEQPAVFDSLFVERFESWLAAVSASWSGASFDGATDSVEKFSGKWTRMQTL